MHLPACQNVYAYLFRYIQNQRKCKLSIEQEIIAQPPKNVIVFKYELT